MGQILKLHIIKCIQATLIKFAFLFFSSTISAQETSSVILNFQGPLNTKGIPYPWKLKVKKGDPLIKITRDENEPVMYMKAVSSSFSLEHELKLNTHEYPYLSWKWKALKLPPEGDVRHRSKNDQALQILVAFKGKKILSYVWDSNAPEGTMADESLPWPLSMKIKVLVVKSGSVDLDRWITFTRNIYEDYKTFFKEEPPFIEGIRIQTNTQHTESIGEALFHKIIISKTPLQSVSHDVLK